MLLSCLEVLLFAPVRTEKEAAHLNHMKSVEAAWLVCSLMMLYQHVEMSDGDSHVFCWLTGFCLVQVTGTQWCLSLHVLGRLMLSVNLHLSVMWPTHKSMPLFAGEIFVGKAKLFPVQGPWVTMAVTLEQSAVLPATHFWGGDMGCWKNGKEKRKEEHK